MTEVISAPAPVPTQAQAPLSLSSSLFQFSESSNKMCMTQNELLLKNLIKFYYHQGDNSNLEKMLDIITGRSRISLRIVDWFATNYAKKKETIYTYAGANGSPQRFKVYTDYKLKLKAYSKKRFDPFCRWERTRIPYHNNTVIETTIGQLNFFKWAIENKILEYISEHFDLIEKDMNSCNTVARRKERTNAGTGAAAASSSPLPPLQNELNSDTSSESVKENVTLQITPATPLTYNVETITGGTTTMKDLSGVAAKTRKKRQELSIAAMKTIRHEKVEVMVNFK